MKLPKAKRAELRKFERFAKNISRAESNRNISPLNRRIIFAQRQNILSKAFGTAKQKSYAKAKFRGAIGIKFLRPTKKYGMFRQDYRVKRK